MAFTKETAIEMLSGGEISEFNAARPYEEDELLDLSEVDFTNFNLVGANLSLADLNGVNFSEMELEGVNFSASATVLSKRLNSGGGNLLISGTSCPFRG